MLHDIGHGPTSHKFDDFTITGEKLLKILYNEKKIFKKYLPYFEHFIQSGNLENKRIEHELVSCVFIIKLIYVLKNNDNLTKESKKIRDSIDIRNILKMIDPKFLYDYEIKINDKNFSDYFNSIIAGFPFDADRMDYLYRDSFYSGVKYGFFDQSRILASLLPVEHEGRFTLGIKKSGLDSIVRFIQSRNHLYNQVYFHKTNSATNSMLDFVFRHLKGQSVLDNIQNYKEFEDFYCKNGDEYFFNSTLKHILEKNGCKICKDVCVENDVLDELLDRNLWKRCFEKRINIEKARQNKDFDSYKFNSRKLKKLKSKLEKHGILIQENYSSNLGLKGFDKSKAVLIDGVETRKDWNKVSDEMKFLSKTNVFIKRIYLRRNKTFTKADEFLKLEKKIKSLIANL